MFIDHLNNFFEESIKIYDIFYQMVVFLLFICRTLISIILLVGIHCRYCASVVGNGRRGMD